MTGNEVEDEMNNRPHPETSQPWRGLIGDREPWEETLAVVAPLGPTSPGATGAFLSILTDDDRWWVKPFEAGQKDSLVNEFVVARLGELIDAPVCRQSPVYIPQDLDFEYRPGSMTICGIGSASLEIPTAIEGRLRLQYESDDDNRRRHVRIRALYDWAVGRDPQWLYASAEENSTYSHDHGFYLGGSPRNEQSLSLASDQPSVVDSEDISFPDPAEIEATADRLRNVTRNEIASVLRSVPAQWDISNGELEMVGSILEHRIGPTADRISQLGADQ